MRTDGNLILLSGYSDNGTYDDNDDDVGITRKTKLNFVHNFLTDNF